MGGVVAGAAGSKVAGLKDVRYAGDVIVVEPGEMHSFVEHTPDYFHFVLHCPPVRGDKAAL